MKNLFAYDFTTNTIVASKATLKKAGNPTTPEYKALMKMIDFIVDQVKDSEHRTLAIAYCNCKERAQQVKEAILKRIKVKDVVLVNTGGVSTMYANDGGIIVAI